jgi:adenylate cyclase
MEQDGSKIKRRRINDDLGANSPITKREIKSLESPRFETWSRHNIASWLADHQGEITPPARLIGDLCRHLAKADFPIYRAYCTLRDLHPQVLARTFLWHRDRGEEEADRFLEEANTEAYVNSPAYILANSGANGFRRRLVDSNTPLDYPILHELKADGVTDYVAMALIFSDGSRHFLSWATDHPNGFSTEQLSYLDDLLPLITLRLEIEHSRHVMVHLLTTYLGHGAAHRVLGGSIHRGQGEEINAIVLFSDLRSFTHLADTLPPADVVSILSEFYEATALPIQQFGGDILKLVGDGLLAIFPMSNDPARVDNVACGAVAAARLAQKNISNIPQARLPKGVDQLRSGIALHVGPVTFGNIGAPDRLDFTVIGPTVNETVRVESLAKTLGKTILTTSAFAGLDCTVDLTSLGFHVLRGVREPKEIFTLAEKT